LLKEVVRTLNLLAKTSISFPWFISKIGPKSLR
jgi:hypothetical protein